MRHQWEYCRNISISVHIWMCSMLGKHMGLNNRNHIPPSCKICYTKNPFIIFTEKSVQSFILIPIQYQIFRLKYGLFQFSLFRQSYKKYQTLLKKVLIWIFFLYRNNIFNIRKVLFDKSQTWKETTKTSKYMWKTISLSYIIFCILSQCHS